MICVLRFTTIIVLCLAPSGSIFAQLPAARLAGVFPAGAVPGATLEVTIAGDDLDNVDRLLFSHEESCQNWTACQPRR